MAADLDIGTRIRKRRQELGLTQQQLADRLEVAESSVVSWETGRHYPKRKLGALEAVLGVNLTARQDAFTFTTPDEAAIWSLDRFSEHERRRLIEALRETRRNGHPSQVLSVGNQAATWCKPRSDYRVIAYVSPVETIIWSLICFSAAAPVAGRLRPPHRHGEDH